MKINVTESLFIDYFNRISPDAFTYEALNALYDYFINYEDCTDCEIELDVIAICCDYAEYTPNELLDAYNHLGDSLETIIDAIREESDIIDVNNGNYIVRGF